MTQPVNIQSNRRAWVLGGVVALLAVGLSGCDFEQPVCIGDSECESGFVCSPTTGYCEPDWERLHDAEASEDAGEPDATSSEEDVVDTTDDQDGGETDEDAPFFPSACVGERTDRGCFTRYEPNDTQLDAEELTASPFGCPYGTGDFRDLDTTKTAGLCGSDTDDYYVLDYVSCRDRTFRVDVVVSPLSSSCSADTYALNIDVDGTTYGCGPDETSSSGDARCTLLSDGRRQMTVFIDRTGTYRNRLLTIHVESKADSGTAFFDYEMRVELQ